HRSVLIDKEPAGGPGPNVRGDLQVAPAGGRYQRRRDGRPPRARRRPKMPKISRRSSANAAIRSAMPRGRPPPLPKPATALTPNGPSKPTATRVENGERARCPAPHAPR